MGVVHLGIRSQARSRCAAIPRLGFDELRMMRIFRSAIIRCFAPKSPSFMLLGACRLKFDRNKVAFLSPLLVVVGFSFVCCGTGQPSTSSTSASRLTTRVVASQSVASPTAFPGLLIIDGEIDTL